jgi:hypothetical protein
VIHLERYRPSPFYVRLDPASGRRRRVFRFRTPPCSGWYDRLGEHDLSLYRVGEELRFGADGESWRLDATAASAWAELPQERARFSLAVGAAVVFACEYRIPVSRLDAADPGFEIGRNDILRAIHGVIADPSRWSDAFRDEQRATRAR